MVCVCVFAAAKYRNSFINTRDNNGMECARGEISAVAIDFKWIEPVCLKSN